MDQTRVGRQALLLHCQPSRRRHRLVVLAGVLVCAVGRPVLLVRSLPPRQVPRQRPGCPSAAPLVLVVPVVGFVVLLLLLLLLQMRHSSATKSGHSAAAVCTCSLLRLPVDRVLSHVLRL